MLGSKSEADDAIQEAWIRLSRANAGEIDNLEAWLGTAAVARVCLDLLRSRKARREQLVGVRMLELLAARPGGVEPEREALVADAVAPAPLVVLETLTSAERLAFVLHDTFGLPFDRIAAVLERSPAWRATATSPTPAPCGLSPPSVPPPAPEGPTTPTGPTARRTTKRSAPWPTGSSASSTAASSTAPATAKTWPGPGPRPSPLDGIRSWDVYRHA